MLTVPLEDPTFQPSGDLDYYVKPGGIIVQDDAIDAKLTQYDNDAEVLKLFCCQYYNKKGADIVIFTGSFVESDFYRMCEVFGMPARRQAYQMVKNLATAGDHVYLVYNLKKKKYSCCW